MQAAALEARVFGTLASQQAVVDEQAEPSPQGSAPDDVVREHFSNPYSGIIALAHDPRVDDMALMEALKTDAFYVGAMGSERTSAARRERLPELGLSKDEIDILHAPIGFQIQSKTPAEIAISIMAEVTAKRHGAL